MEYEYRCVGATVTPITDCVTEGGALVWVPAEGFWDVFPSEASMQEVLQASLLLFVGVFVWKKLREAF